ncbi:hypothetical protein BDQ17DRAFT_1420672 [Cyathus striatus]|nr:hypothetical protein BDQ17DRAFT_1420672 [Cyathus striatus]
MVRADTNDSSDGKKESTAKKQPSPSKKKNGGSRMWPCKINGCNKQFAREADLKRHQRTTKLHSLPSFSCPQCEATFTRTDALRRHQKSRHKGVVVEPSTDSGKKETDEDEDTQMSPSPSSRDATPSSKSQDRTTPVQAQVATASTTTSSHYRDHTSMPFIFPRPAYPPVPLPEDATKLHPINTWESPWPGGPTGTLPSAYPMSLPPGSSHPSLHYRHPMGINQPRNPGSVSPTSTSSQSSFSIASDADAQPVSASAERDEEAASTTTEVVKSEAFQQALAGLIGSGGTNANGPIRESSSPGPSRTINPVSLHSTASTSTRSALPPIETMGLLHGSPLNSHSPCLQSCSPTSFHRHSPIRSRSSHDQDEGGPLMDPLEPSLDDPYASKPLERPEPMEHLVTENGELMLNPAELLTQESLASPPPS